MMQDQHDSKTKGDIRLKEGKKSNIDYKKHDENDGDDSDIEHIDFETIGGGHVV